MYDTVEFPQPTIGTTGKLVSVDRVILHEDYNSYSQVNDIALIHVKTPFEFGETVRYDYDCLDYPHTAKSFFKFHNIVKTRN